MKKIYGFILIVLGIIGISFVGINTEASEETLRNKCSQLVSFISEHLEEFKREYNKKNEDILTAVGIEGYSLVYIIDSKEYGVYLDFNEDNGYMVSSFAFNLYALETSGDLEYLKNETFTYYSVLDGFLYHDGSSYQKYIKETKDASIFYKYNGQGSAGEGDIYNISLYMADRYPSYILEADYRQTLTEGNYVPTNMLSTSYFIKKISTDGGQTYTQVASEANCGLTAAFNVMSSWGQMGHYVGFPLKTEYRDMREAIQDNPNYAVYGTGFGGLGIDYYWTTNYESRLEHIPELYYQARYLATVSRGYTPESGLTTEAIQSVFTFCTGHFPGQGLYTRSSTNFADVMSYLQAGRAVFMGVQNSTSFGEAHAVALLGYMQYSYKTGVWIFSQTKTAYFFMIDDGHESSVTYFDPNCNSSLSFEFVYPKE